MRARTVSISSIGESCFSAIRRASSERLVKATSSPIIADLIREEIDRGGFGFPKLGLPPQEPVSYGCQASQRQSKVLSISVRQISGKFFMRYLAQLFYRQFRHELAPQTAILENYTPKLPRYPVAFSLMVAAEKA